MLSAKIIIEKLGCKRFIGDMSTPISNIENHKVANYKNDSLYWCSDKNIQGITNINAGTVICSELALSQELSAMVNYIIVNNPRQYLSDVIRSFFYKASFDHHISHSAKIDSSVVMGTPCFIGEHVVIEEGCILGNNCYIGHNTILHRKTVIKDNVIIGCNNTIGGVGFGYEKNSLGEYVFLPHIGNVIIENNVELGNNVCIDRAVLGSTVIGDNVKIDNLVHIAHGVIIGKNSLIIANAMIAGSVDIGENVWIAPSSSIINKVGVGNNAVVGLGAVVIKTVEANSVVVGNPAKKI